VFLKRKPNTELGLGHLGSSSATSWLYFEDIEHFGGSDFLPVKMK
jgi:hypothetical protein